MEDVLDETALLETLLASAPVGIGFLDRELRFVRLNETLAAANSRSREQHLGRRIDEIWPEIPAGLLRALEDMLDGGCAVNYEVASRLGGRDRWAVGTYYPIAGADGVVAGVGIIVTDITRRKQMEDEQTALRRVATLVAQEAEPEEVFQSVAEELAELTRTITASLIRFDETSATIVGRVDRSGENTFPIGTVLTFEGDSVIRRIRDTGRPARIDSYKGLPGRIAEQMRQFGYSSVAGAPVTVAGTLWGAVLVESRDPEPLALGVEDQLTQFGELVGQAVANAEARTDLRASRARIVEAGDSERRRLERNLHDGAQQRLVTLSLALRLAAARVEDDPPQARVLLGQAAEELAQALAELRELARGIHPAVLSDRGLAPALESLAERAPVPVRIGEMVEERLPEQVEAAAYFVVAEALTNVVKYARAASVEVRVKRANGRALIEVIDDGVGGADASAGSGLRGLADRVEALGGRLDVESPPGSGTTLSASIPVAPSSG